jgi:ATP-dependent RNA helicase RhlE
VASRGLDIEQLPHVVNFELPNVPEDYVHRIGRTGRAGHEGQAVSLVSSEEYPLLKDIERLLGRTLVKDVIAGYEPTVSAQREADQSSRNQAQSQKQSAASHSKSPLQQEHALANDSTLLKDLLG